MSGLYLLSFQTKPLTIFILLTEKIKLTVLLKKSIMSKVKLCLCRREGQSDGEWELYSG